MPLVNEELKTENFQSQGFSQNAQANDAFQTNSPTQKGLLTLPPALMQLIPWIPFALEAFTGQKVPAIGGTMGEIQSSLQQIQFSLTQLLSNQQRVLSSQQQLYTKLESLESNASNQLTNLSQQVKDFRLLATETKRSLELNSRPRINEPEREM